MQHSWKQSIGVLTVACGLVVGTAGVAMAEAGNPSGSGDAASATGQGRHVRRGAIKAAFDAAVATIGIEPQALKDAVKGGQTVGQVADANGSSAQAVVDAVVAALEGKVDAAVAAGTIDSARAAKVKERIPAAADRFVNTLPRRVKTGSAG